VKVVDLPGTYSLQAGSVDEEVARDFVLFGRPDVTVVVVDATRLERNLNLVIQILEITDRVVVFLNLMDEARRHGIASTREARGGAGRARRPRHRAGGRGRRRPARGRARGGHGHPSQRAPTASASTLPTVERAVSELSDP
jgi:hypothetical protein